jgi:predicted XRE-type DNA-binding protein
MAEHLQIRSTLLIAVNNIISDRQLTQVDAAKLFGVLQPQNCDLVRGKIELFTIDMLVTMLSRAGVHVTVALSSACQGRRSWPYAPVTELDRRSLFLSCRPAVPSLSRKEATA